MRSIVLIITAVAVLVSLDPLVITAQQGPGSAPSRGPGWLPRRSFLNDLGVRLTPAELTTVLGRLAEIDRTFLEVDELANPVGFEIEPLFGGGPLTESVVGYRYDLMFFRPTKKIAGEGSACVSVTVNHPSGRGINAMNGYRDDRGEFVFEDRGVTRSPRRPTSGTVSLQPSAVGST